jgi:glutamyl-tRNA synthetase
MVFMSQPDLVTRFEPSPTGYLHIGGARTALFCWLLARHHGDGGKYFLRIADTDLARSTRQAEVQLLEDLRWLGLHWDNPDNLIRQSQRLPVYNEIIAGLLARNLAYEAWETPEELNAMRQEAERSKRAFIYRRRAYTSDQVAQFKSEGRKPVVRFATPVKPYSFFDVIANKEIVQPAEEVQDFVIRKADGMPTYHFAVVVDDAAMGITHVLRGQEHTKNTFLHIALQEALGYSRPIYAHLSTIQNMDGSKMGKRDRDKKVREQTNNYLKNTKKSATEVAAAAGLPAERIQQWLSNSKSQLDPSEHEQLMPVIGLKPSDLPEVLVHDFRRNGYLPEALLNFVALLGWSPGENREIMSLDEMIRLFSLERISNASARFDRAKLLAFNMETLKTASTERLVGAMRQYLETNPDSPLNHATNEQLAAVIDMKRGVRTLRELDDATRFFFVPDDQIAYDDAAAEKVLRKNGNEGFIALHQAALRLQALSEWTAHEIEIAVQTYCTEKSLALGKVAQPIRFAVTGTTVSPPIFQSLEFLGKNCALRRINRCSTHYAPRPA